MKKQNYLLSLISIFAVCFLAQGTAAVSAVVQMMIEAFPDVPVATVRLASTVPSLTSTAAMLILGPVVGKKIGFKKVYLFGLLCFLIGGIGPSFVSHNIYLIIACRALFGVAIGCFGSREAYIISVSPKEKSAAMVGFGATIYNAGGVTMQLICGILADIAWQYAFYVYAIGFIPLLLVIFFMKELDLQETSDESKTKNQNQTKEKMNPQVWLFAFFLFFAAIFAYPCIVGASSHIVQRGLGGATEAAVVIIFSNGGGVVSGLIFGKINNVLKRWCAPFFSMMMIVGSIVLILADNMAVLCIGSFLAGYGFLSLMITCLAYAGMCTGGSTRPFATTMVQAMMAAGCFVATFFMSWVTQIVTIFPPGFEMGNIYAGCAVGAAVLLVISLVIRFYPNTHS